jgi:aldehyde:ferredoxin oxidoreductase
MACHGPRRCAPARRQEFCALHNKWLNRPVAQTVIASTSHAQNADAEHIQTSQMAKQPPPSPPHTPRTRHDTLIEACQAISGSRSRSLTVNTGARDKKAAQGCAWCPVRCAGAAEQQACVGQAPHWSLQPQCTARSWRRGRRSQAVQNRLAPSSPSLGAARRTRFICVIHCCR